MTENEFTPEQKKLLLKAQKVIDKASVGYVEILEQHIRKLKESLNSDDITEAIHICHLMHSQAGTLGWPLVSEVSGWFKRILKTQQKDGLNSNVSALFCHSFDSILQNKLKAESDKAVKLLVHIETILKKEGIR